MVVPLTSAAGIIAMLDEPVEELRLSALKKLDALVDVFWTEISDSISKIEVLFEDTSFKHREVAALLASKVYYHLGEFNDSLTFALGAGKLFDLNGKSEYIYTTIAKGIEKYIDLRRSQATSSEAVEIDPRLEAIVQQMFQRCFKDGEFEQAIGIALESFRLDIVEQAISLGNASKLLPYILDANTNVVQNLEFRNQVYRLLVKHYQALSEPDYLSISHCLTHLTDAASLVGLLKDLLAKGDFGQLMAYQIAFDLNENGTQELVIELINGLGGPETTENSDDSSPLSKVKHILSGELSTKLYLEFLYRNNHSDLLILKNTKTCLDSRSSLYHSAVTFANAFMHAGTTSDEFLRQNLEWLSRATNWVKFSATAALGVIHKGQISQSMHLLAPYLPKEGVSGSSFSEGGSLYALGLIHANHGLSILPYLTNQLKVARDETIQHGAALGLGVAGMATGNEEIFEELKNVLYSDNAVAGEAAGIAMGLVMLGKASQKAIDEMLQYAHETQHEKIIRGLALGLSFIMFAREEAADAFIDELCADKDPILRYGGIYTVAMAYAGTGNNKAIKRLLHVAVSDTSDDVRRAAVTGLGFLLFKSPQQVPHVVQLLAESYNPHVRYGATLALGIACAGTGMPEALELLEPMTKDNVDFVRQGALIALALILVQHNEAYTPKVADTRKLYEKIISEKREEQMARFGASLAQGIIDAGGRNVTISLQSQNGAPNLSAIVGMSLFTQFWYWHPLTHFLSLAFTPTALIGLNKDLKVPKFEVLSNARPSLFAYPPPTKPPTAEVIEKVAAAVLSTTAKAKARAKKQEKEKKEAAGEITPMDTDEKKESPVDEAAASKPASEEPVKKKEESSESILNLTRVLPTQAKFIAFKEGSRFAPVRKGALSGILLLSDSKPSEAVEFIEISVPSVASSSNASATVVDDPNEPGPPEPFEYIETD